MSHRRAYLLLLAALALVLALGIWNGWIRRDAPGAPVTTSCCG